MLCASRRRPSAWSSDPLVLMQAEAALHHAMKEARKRDESIHKGIDFDSFLTMLRSNSCDSLDQVQKPFKIDIPYWLPNLEEGV